MPLLLCVSPGKVRLFCPNGSALTLQRELQRDTAEQQAAVSTALSVRLENLGAKGNRSPLQQRGKILSLKYTVLLKHVSLLATNDQA